MNNSSTKTEISSLRQLTPMEELVCKVQPIEWIGLETRGLISDSLRILLHQRIQETHQSHDWIARKLGIAVATLNKWEKGPTNRCATALRLKLAHFLKTGNLPSQTASSWAKNNFFLRDDDELDDFNPSQELMKSYQQTCARLDAIYDACSQFPNLRDRFLQGVLRLYKCSPDPLQN